MDDEESYYNDGGMAPDGPRRRSTSKGFNAPKFRRMTRNVPHTDFGEIMGGLTFGMLLIFPAIAILTMAYPFQVLLILAAIFLLSWVFNRDLQGSLLILGLCVAPIVLGFVSLGFFKALFS